MGFYLDKIQLRLNFNTSNLLEAAILQLEPKRLDLKITGLTDGK
jgi:hypothetical protein